MGLLKKLLSSDEAMSPELRAKLDESREKARARDYEAALNTLQQVLKNSPKCAEAHYETGRVYARREDWAAAEAALRKALKLNPQLADAWRDLGDALLQRKNTHAAIEAYKKEAELNPDPDRAVQIARLIQKEEKSESAAVFLEKSLKHSDAARGFSPTSRATAYFELGSLLLELRKTDAAVKYLRKAVETHPRHAEAHFRLSQALQRDGDSREGIEHMKEAARLGHAEAQSKLLKHRIEWR